MASPSVTLIPRELQLTKKYSHGCKTRTKFYGPRNLALVVNRPGCKKWEPPMKQKTKSLWRWKALWWLKIEELWMAYFSLQYMREKGEGLVHPRICVEVQEEEAWQVQLKMTLRGLLSLSDHRLLFPVVLLTIDRLLSDQNLQPLKMDSEWPHILS